MEPHGDVCGTYYFRSWGGLSCAGQAQRILVRPTAMAVVRIEGSKIRHMTNISCFIIFSFML